MKLLFLIIAFLPGIVQAKVTLYDWMLKQYESKNGTVIANQTLGLIDGETYMVLVARDVDEKRDVDTSGKEQYLGVFKQIQERFVGIALARLMPVGNQDYPGAEIKNNSIYLTTSYCHHGCSDTRYQFKIIGQQFKLVGVESENSTHCFYFDEENAPPECDCSVESGNSYNFLSATTICWAHIDPQCKTLQKLPKQYQPRGVQHKVAFSKFALPLLDGFRVENFSLPRSCYFDYKKRVHFYSPNP